MGKREDQIGSHKKLRHQEGGAHKTCLHFLEKQMTKVVWPLLEVITQTISFWETEQRLTEKKRRRDNIKEELKKYLLTEDKAN